MPDFIANKNPQRNKVLKWRFGDIEMRNKKGTATSCTVEVQQDL